MWYFDINGYLSRNKIIFEIFQPTPSTGLVPVQETIAVRSALHAPEMSYTYVQPLYVSEATKPLHSGGCIKILYASLYGCEKPQEAKIEPTTRRASGFHQAALLRLPSWATANDSIHHQHKKRSRSSSFEVNDDFFTTARWLVARCDVSEPLPPHTNCILLHSAVWHTTHP